MLDQIFGRFFSSQWIVFAVLVILLVGFSELAWRIGVASSGKKSGRGQGQRHRKIGGAGFVGIVATPGVEWRRGGDQGYLPKLYRRIGMRVDFSLAV